MKKEKKEIHLKDKQMAMKHRRDEAKMKVPMQNMAYKDDPPAFVTVVGSKSSGKSTLIKALVKKLSKNTLENVLGPVTLTINKDKRITIFECQPDIHQFVDTSKVSDLVIFVIDARVGLEMETFEYINLLMSHGLPKLLFVVTHCDKKNNQDMLKKIKKRIWSEVCDGLKFFYLGFENKKYTEIEFLNLVRSIKGMKYRPIEWKCSHPHIIVDNTDDNHVYGYVRGGSIRKNIDVHIPGSGDTKILDFEILEDPVPIKTEGRLSSRRDILYGPMSFKELENDEEEKSEGELDFNFNNDEIKLFKQSSAPVVLESDSESEEVPVEINEKEITKPKLEKIEKDNHAELTDIDKLKDLIKNKFRKNAENEEEWVDKFNSKYEEKTKKVENFIEKQREEILANKEKNLENKTKDVAFPGDYLKIKLENPISVDVDFTKILVLGVLNISEITETVLQGKVKKSKWHKKLLKTNEPYIFSLGWRRFQSIPVFSSKTTEINRMLKYSFQHGFSAINFYGSIVPPGTGFSIYSETGDFRILGQGTILDATGDHKLVKKLKLVGYPKSITGNTVVVKSMFTSDLEVLKFKYGKLKTASGLKGIIKNVIGKKGDFRASFEGEMLSNDIIILRCYVDFPVYEHIIPVNDLYEKWKGLRSLKEIRDELGIKIENNFEEDLESEEDFNEQIYEDEFKLPSDIEKELPLDKRQMKVVNERIELPIAPENKKRYEETKRIEVLRKEKDKRDLIKQNREKEIKEKEYEEFLKVKEEKKKKKIVESALDKQKRHKGFKKKKKKKR